MGIPNDSGSSRNALAFGLAYALERLGNTADAVTQYEKTLAAHPDYAECWAAFGKLRLADKQYDQAKNCFDEALRLDPGMNDLKLLLGAIWERVGNFDKVKDLLGPALKISQNGSSSVGGKSPQKRHLIPEPDPYYAATRKPIGPAPYYIIYARMKLKFGDPISAEKYFKRAIQIDPSKLIWNAYLADIAYDRADWDSAANFYDIAHAAAPDVAKYRTRLAACRENAATAKAL